MKKNAEEESASSSTADVRCCIPLFPVDLVQHLNEATVLWKTMGKVKLLQPKKMKGVRGGVDISG